jgi:hypothetical protein
MNGLYQVSGSSLFTIYFPGIVVTCQLRLLVDHLEVGSLIIFRFLFYIYIYLHIFSFTRQSNLTRSVLSFAPQFSGKCRVGLIGTFVRGATTCLHRCLLGTTPVVLIFLFSTVGFSRITHFSLTLGRSAELDS